VLSCLVLSAKTSEISSEPLTAAAGEGNGDGDGGHTRRSRCQAENPVHDGRRQHARRSTADGAALGQIVPRRGRERFHVRVVLKVKCSSKPGGGQSALAGHVPFRFHKLTHAASSEASSPTWTGPVAVRAQLFSYVHVQTYQPPHLRSTPDFVFLAQRRVPASHAS